MRSRIPTRAERREARVSTPRGAGVDSGPRQVQLDLDRATNPFLRVSDRTFKAKLGLEELPDAQVFAEIRRRKDAF